MKTLTKMHDERTGKVLAETVYKRLLKRGWRLICMPDPFSGNSFSIDFKWEMTKIIVAPITSIDRNGSVWWGEPVMCFRDVAHLFSWIDGGCKSGPTTKVLKQVRKED